MHDNNLASIDIRPEELGVHGQLFDLYDQMLGEVDLGKVLKNTTDFVRQLFNAERATTYLVLENTQELESVAVIGNVSRAIKVPIRKSSLSGYCALSQRAFAIPDAYGDLSHIDPKLNFDRSWDALNQFRTRDVMCAPAIFKNEVMGVIQVINSKDSVFQDTDLTALESMSRFVAYALYHARLYNELATLKCLDKEKADFMRIVVHELKSPVAASKSLVSALSFTHQGDSSLTKMLGRVEQRMDQLLELVEDILNLSRVKSGRPLSEIGDCDLTADSAQICDDYREQAESKGLNFTVNLPQNPVMVRIDRQGFKLILSNLVSNAVKYTAAGSVGMALQTDDSGAVITVTDSGMGIPKTDIDQLFTEFFRASNARQSKIKGTGVGLAGVKEMAERFGGELSLISQEGVGSTFTVRLPLSQNGA